MSEQLFKITIDNIAIEVPAGTTILNAARKIGGDVTPPAMCYYSKLKDSGGKCRTCLVEVSKGSEKDPRPMPKLVASCRTTVKAAGSVAAPSCRRRSNESYDGHSGARWILSLTNRAYSGRVKAWPRPATTC